MAGHRAGRRALADVIASANIARATIAFTLPGFHSGLFPSG